VKSACTKEEKILGSATNVPRSRADEHEKETFAHSRPSGRGKGGESGSGKKTALAVRVRNLSKIGSEAKTRPRVSNRQLCPLRLALLSREKRCKHLAWGGRKKSSEPGLHLTSVRSITELSEKGRARKKKEGGGHAEERNLCLAEEFQTPLILTIERYCGRRKKSEVVQRDGLTE